MFRSQTHSLRRQNRIIRPVTRSPQLTRRCLFEPLEDRRLLACDVKVDGRTLFVRGDEGDNIIAVVGRNENLLVTCDGSFTRVPSGDIDDIQIKGGKGNDTLSAAAIAAVLHLFGDDGDDSMNYDVNSDGKVEPTDALGGGGHNTFTINTSALAELIKIIGIDNRDIPDPEITVSNAAGTELADLFVQEFDGITVNTRGGDDQVELEDSQGFFAGLDLAINTGDGADIVAYNVIRPDGDECGEGFLCASPSRLSVNLGSTPGPDDKMTGFLAEDHFLLDATAGWNAPGDPSHPATIEVLGGRGTQRVTLKFGQIGEPVPGNQIPTGLTIHMALGSGDDSANSFYGSGIYKAVAVNAEMGGGNDEFAASFAPDSSAAQAGGGAWRGAVMGGAGNDTFMMNVGDNNSSEPVLPHIGYDLDVSFDGGGGGDTFLIGMLNVALDGPVAVNLNGGGHDDGIDQMKSQYRGTTFGSSLDITEIGGGGNDVFTDDYSLVEWRGPVTFNQHGGAGADQTSFMMQKVRLGDTAHIGVDSGIGADQILLNLAGITGPLQTPPQAEAAVAAVREAALDIDVLTGDGRDQVRATMQDIGVDLHLDANLGRGNDTFLGTVMPDSSVGPGGGCIEANVKGSGGADTLMMNVGDFSVDQSNPNEVAAELMLNFDGGSGGDSFLIGLLNVAIDGPVTITEVGGAGNDSFHDTFAQVAAGGGAWNIAHQGDAGNDSLYSSFFDLFADLSIGDDLGSGNDTAIIAILRKEVPSGLVPAVRVEVGAGAGNDDVTLAIDRAIEDFSAFLDGGKGRDFDHVTENVKAKGQIVNFEKEEVLPYIE